MSFQLDLAKEELDRLGRLVEEDYKSAEIDHQKRMDRFVRLYRLWKGRSEAPPPGEEDASNFKVPVIKWNVFAKWAMEIDALFGDDAEVVAVPEGPSDHRIVKKIGHYMSWRVLRSMEKFVKRFAVFDFRKLLFGRSFAYRGWSKKRVAVRKEDGSVGYETGYDGPVFIPLWPDDVIVPAETAESIDDYSFVIRRWRARPQDLLDGERDGEFFGIQESFDEIIRHASEGDYSEDKTLIQQAEDEAAGVTRQGGFSGRDGIEVWEWYGRYRLPRNGSDGGEDLNDLKQRELDQTDLCVSVIPGLGNKVIGVRRLVDLYPRMANKRPIYDAKLINDGTEWPDGFGELLKEIEAEATVNHNLFTEAGQFSVGPIIFYRPDAFDAKQFRYEPFSMVPTTDPDKVNVVAPKADLQYPILKEQSIMGYSERLTGISDSTLGRSIDRPNAPRTATGQIALIEQGNIRASLDTRMLREDMKALLFDLWQLDCDLGNESVFFRVTEEQASGAFSVSMGGSHMTAIERHGKYDFDIRFADNVYSREAKKQQGIALYQLDLTNPLVVQNPRALWKITKNVHDALGDPNFADLIPEPPDLDQPRKPKEEWAMMLQGEPVVVHPQDNDEQHIFEHQMDLRASWQQEPPYRDVHAEDKLRRHILEHTQAKRQKMLMQALTSVIAQDIAAATQNPALGGISMGQPQSMPIQQLQAALAGIQPEMGMGMGQSPSSNGGPPNDAQ